LFIGYYRIHWNPCAFEKFIQGSYNGLAGNVFILPTTGAVRYVDDADVDGRRSQKLEIRS
jgi:hypothetical protein